MDRSDPPSAPDAAGGAPADVPAARLRPVETDTARIVAFGTGVFAVAFVVLLVLRAGALGWSAEHGSWLWTALAGWLLGLGGLLLVARHRRLGRTR